MITRHLGDLAVSALGLGCMGMTASYGRVDPIEARSTLAAALEAGITLFDTAAMYGGGKNERFIGPIMAAHREDVVVATKTGIRTLGPLPIGLDGRPRTVRDSLDASLGRLGLDHVDLFYLHRVDPRVPVEESIGAMAEGLEAGKTLHLGISECTPDELRRAHATHPLSALQIEWSLFSRQAEAELIPTARELGIGVVAYSPLGRGMLTGSPSATTNLPLLDYRRALPRWRRANLRRNLEAVEVVKKVARRHDVAPGQIALAWVLARGEDVVPIPGTKRVKYLRENVGALDVHLDANDLAELDAIRPTGARYGSGAGTFKD